MLWQLQRYYFLLMQKMTVIFKKEMLLTGPSRWVYTKIFVSTTITRHLFRLPDQ